MNVNNIKYLCISTFSVFALASCSQEAELPELIETSVTARITDSPATRTQIAGEPGTDGTLGIKWTSTDKIGVFGTNTSNAAFSTNISTPAQTATFTGTIQREDAIAYAYYPYSSSATSATDVPASIATTQAYSGMTSISGRDIKMAKASGSSTLDFKAATSIIRIAIDASGVSGLASDEKIERVTIKDEAGNALTGSFKLDLKAESITAVQGVDSVIVALTEKPTAAAGVAVAYASVFPGVKKGDKLSIVVNTTKHTISGHFDSKVDYIAGSWYSANLTLSGSDFTVAEEELPEGDPSALPSITSFKFTVAANSGKILDKLVYSTGSATTVKSGITEQTLTQDADGNWSLCIPYLYDFDLVPTFTLSNTDERYYVTVDGVEQVSGTTSVNFAETVTYTVRDRQTRATKDCTVHVYNTGLPVVVLVQNTEGQANMPANKNKFLDMTIPNKDQEWGTEDKITVYKANGVIDVAEQNCGFRLRGNFSADMPKKPIAVKLSEKVKVLGMNKHKRWCLLANCNDRTLIRNAVAFDIARNIAATTEDGTGLDWQPTGEPVELVLNGRHVGSYFLCEQIKIGSKRVAVSDEYEDVRDAYASDPVANPAPAFSNCGYLIEFDTNIWNSSNGTENWWFYTTYCYATNTEKIPVISKNEYDDTEAGQAIWSQLQSSVNTVDEYVFNSAGSSASNQTNYANFCEAVDVTSVVDYMLVYEIAMNHDYKHPKSVYFHKDGEGKYFMGPVWDFDVWTFPNIDNINSMSNYETYPNSYTKFQWQTETIAANGSFFWYNYLVKNPEFVSLIKSRWSAISSSATMSEDAVNAIIDKWADKVKLSAQYDNEMWPHSQSYFNSGYQNGDEWSKSGAYTYDDAIALMKSFYKKRKSGLSTAVNSL